MTDREFAGFVLAEVRSLRTDMGSRFDALDARLAAKADAADVSALDVQVDALRQTVSRWRGVAATLGALWAAVTTGAGLWFAKGQP